MTELQRAKEGGRGQRRRLGEARGETATIRGLFLHLPHYHCIAIGPAGVHGEKVPGFEMGLVVVVVVRQGARRLCI